MDDKDIAPSATTISFGRDPVTFAAAGTKYVWTPQSAFLSSRYTTRWNDLLQV